MSQIPLLSVCIVTYNQDNYITDVLEGAIQQRTNFPFEIVIGEDSSTDDTRRICEDYACKYPNIIRLLPSFGSNLGLNQNMLRTYRACSGKYIAYLEGDDHWITYDKLQKQVDILEQNEDIVLVHTNCKLWNVKTGEFTDKMIRFEGECVREKKSGIEGIIAEYEGHFRHMKTSTCVYRKSTFDEILEEDEYAYSNPDFPTQDFQLFQDMAYRGRFAFIDEDTTVIALSETISVSSDPLKQLKFRIGFNKIGLYYKNKYQIPQESANKWLQREMHWFLNFAMSQGEFEKEVIERWEVAVDNGYQPSLTQRGLLFLLQHPFLKRIVKPVYQIYYQKRG